MKKTQHLWQGWTGFPPSCTPSPLNTSVILSFQCSKERKWKKKEENHFPLANDPIKHISAAARGEESGMITPAWKETQQRDAPNSALLPLVVPLSSPVAWKAQYLVCSALDF